MVTLEACPLFSQLTPGELKVLRAAALERKFSDNQEIFKEGDTGDGVYVVQKGTVQISGLVGKDVRHVFSTVKPGEIFGEMAVIENKPRSASAVASGQTVVYFIPRETMLELVGTSPHLSLGLLREISNRLREFNRQYIQEVIQTERLAIVGRFARSIVHDLKNPLNIISITAELAGMEKSTQERRREAKTSIIKQVDRITELVNEILEFTQGSQTAFVPAPMDYAWFVHQVIDELRPEIEMKSAKIEFENEPPSIKLQLNPKRLRRVYYNLLHNATDAMTRGGRILLRFQPTDTQVITEIEDTGPGIPPEIADQLFKAFVTFGKVHGTGLGLSICKKVIEDHHGTISARNKPGHGAIFSFTLPILQPA
ncbi:MAG TPA: ATP-binding protein [Verrucomicrobiae bacterium]|nr:ATP-binding protein [Verrucomicrobiae bacterium]